MKVKVQHLWGALVKERAVLRRLVAKTRNQHRCTPHFLALTRVRQTHVQVTHTERNASHVIHVLLQLLSCVSAIRSLKPNLLLDEAATLVAQPQRNQQQYSKLRSVVHVLLDSRHPPFSSPLLSCRILWRALQIQHFCALCAQVIQQCERCFR